MRTVKSAKEFTDQNAIAKALTKRVEKGVMRLGSFGSQLPDGIFDSEITGYRLVDLWNDQTKQDECIVLYQFVADIGGGKEVKDTCLANETPDEILPVGTERKVEKFRANNGREYNRFVVEVSPEMTTKGATTVRVAAGEEEDEDEGATQLQTRNKVTTARRR